MPKPNNQVVPIKRDRGRTWVAYTGNPDHGVIRDKFEDRYGFAPDDVHEEYGITFVGPAPERVDEIDLYDYEED